MPLSVLAATAQMVWWERPVRSITTPFWNWSVTFLDEGVTQIEQVEQMIDQETDEPVVDSNGDEVYDELWEHTAAIVLKFYNNHDWWTDPSQRSDVHKKGNELELRYEYFEGSIISPSDIELGVTEEDAAAGQLLDDVRVGRALRHGDGAAFERLFHGRVGRKAFRYQPL